jgi:hypothetical protein
LVSIEQVDFGRSILVNVVPPIRRGFRVSDDLENAIFCPCFTSSVIISVRWIDLLIKHRAIEWICFTSVSIPAHKI